MLLSMTVIVMLATACSSSIIKHPTPVIPEPVADQGLVYFYRPSSFFGAAISYDVKRGFETAGAIRNGTYFFTYTPPGPQVFWAKTEAKKEVLLNIEPGETYYVRCGVGFGIFVGRPKFKIVHGMTGKNAILRCTYATIR